MTDRYMGAMLEEIRDQNTTILELIGTMIPWVREIPAMKADIAELKVDMKVVKVAVTATNKQVKDHERRIVRLETA